MKIRILLFTLMLTTIVFYAAKKSVLAQESPLDLEDIRSEIKCPDHDNPEILSLIDKLINEGENKDAIMDAVAENFGEEVFSITRKKKIGIIPYLIPTFILIIAFIIVFVYIKKWISKAERINQLDKEIVDASKDVTDHNKRFIEEYEIFKKED